MTMKSMKAARAVAPPKRRPSTKVAKVMPAKTAVKVFKAMKAMKAATDDSVAPPAAMPFMGTGTTKMPVPDKIGNARDTPGYVAGGAPPPLQVALQQSWHVDTRDVPEIWIDAVLLSQRPALPGDKILLKVFKWD